MPFFKSHPETAGPANVFTSYPEIYRLWSEMSQELMNGPSPLSSGEREMIASFVVGTAGCKFAYVAHSEAAYAHGVQEGLIEELLDNIDTADIDDKLRPIFKFVRKLTVTPADMTQEDADAVLMPVGTKRDCMMPSQSLRACALCSGLSKDTASSR